MASITLAELAKKLGAELRGDGECEIHATASLDKAKEGELTFLTASKYRGFLRECKASVVLLKEADTAYCNTNMLVMSNPYLGYALTAQYFDTTPDCASDIATSAYIASTANLGIGVCIGHNAVIEEGVVLGDHVQIGAGCVIGKNTTIGAGTRLWANVTVYHDTQMGESCLVQSGAVIGADGFGYANDKGRWIKIPQVGRVIIGSRVEIGANTTIDRGTLDDTLIADGVIIDNQCQVGHNVSIGENTAIAAASAMGGSLTLGSHCNIGGASVINGHIEITDGVSITGMSMVMRPITEPGVYSSGIPVQANREWRKMVARVMKIDDLYHRLKVIEKEKNSK